MNLLDAADQGSIWRGLDYYLEKRVLSYYVMDKDHIRGKVAGSQSLPYEVALNLNDVHTSLCNCPYAKDKEIICKHKIALYFTLYPEIADGYLADANKIADEHDRKHRERILRIVNIVDRLSTSEMKTVLISYMLGDNDLFMNHEETILKDLSNDKSDPHS